jgi:predicted RNA-binding Zn ribbon-like protein
MFRLLGGNLALDFVNTVGGRTPANSNRYEIEREHLTLIDDLYDWALAAGILNASERRRLASEARAHPRLASSVFARSIRLRESLYRLFVGTHKLDVLNDELSIARTHERLSAVEGRVQPVWDDDRALDRPLWDVARAAAALLTSDQLSRVRQCPGESCGWLFLDTSRNRSRQWCDMNDCGNLAKVRRFRERQKA